MTYARRASSSALLRRGGVALMIAIACASTATSAKAEEEDEAKAYFLLGRARYEAGDFGAAAVQFEEAYRISRRPALLYNLYVAYRDAGDTKNAARTLREYLSLEPNVENRPQLEAKLAALERSAATSTPEAPAQPAATPAPGAPQGEAAPAAPQAAPAAASEPAESDDGGSAELPVLPLALLGVGGAMIVGSVVTGLMASSAQSELEDECPSRRDCPRGLEDTKSRGETLALVTDVLLFGGIAVAGTGGALWLFASPSNDEPSASAACGLHGCAASVRLRF